MLDVKCIPCNMLQENCYIVSDETRDCVIIDCGALYREEQAAISHYIREKGLSPVHLLATHGHLDHNFGNDALYKEFGLTVRARAEDAFLIEHLSEQAIHMFGIRMDESKAPVGPYFADNETCQFGTHELRILHTPGHTPGSCVFYCEAEKAAFTGDTLFRMSIGRTDFEGGSWERMTESLRLLAHLPVNTILYCGHGPQSVMDEELRYNPYLKA